MINQAGLASILFVVDVFFDNDRGDCVELRHKARLSEIVASIESDINHKPG
jgi:hypothetical protein